MINLAIKSSLRVFLAVLATMSTLAALPAEAGISCNGASLWPRISEATRQQLIAAAHREPFPAGRYFRIERGGRVSYILGTIHVPPIRQLSIPSFVLGQIGKSRVVYLEKTLKEFAAFEARLKNDPSYAIAQGLNGFSRYFTAAEWKVVQDSVVDAGMKRGYADTFNPWFLYDRIEGIGCSMDYGGFRMSLDERVIKEAARQKIPMGGLETPEIVDAYYRALPLANLVAMTKALPPQNPKYPHGPVGKAQIDLLASEEIVLATLFRDWVDQQYLDANGVRLRAAFREQKIVLARNQAWMPTLTTAFNTGGAFVAVGAAHLNGRYGLLEMLRRKGFTITRVALK